MNTSIAFSNQDLEDFSGLERIHQINHSYNRRIEEEKIQKNSEEFEVLKESMRTLLKPFRLETRTKYWFYKNRTVMPELVLPTQQRFSRFIKALTELMRQIDMSRRYEGHEEHEEPNKKEKDGWNYDIEALIVEIWVSFHRILSIADKEPFNIPDAQEIIEFFLSMYRVNGRSLGRLQRFMASEKFIDVACGILKLTFIRNIQEKAPLN